MGGDTILHQGPGFVIALTDVAGSVVPYPPVERVDSRNHGFMDLRDRPQLVAQVPEAQKCEGIAVMLRAANDVGSPLMTVGCECALFPVEDPTPGHPTFLAGGYVDITFRSPARNADPANLVALARRIIDGVQPPKVWYSYELIVEPLKAFFGLPDRFALMVKPQGWGNSEEEAWAALSLAAGAAGDSIGSLDRDAFRSSL